MSEAFICEKCGSRGGHVERLAMSCTGLSRLFEIQLCSYAYVSCRKCGHTEIYNLKTLEGSDDPGNLLEIIFAN
ncbi:MAG: zinc ribbon domain-containing protein [Anaerolineales bacterium]